MPNISRRGLVTGAAALAAFGCLPKEPAEAQLSVTGVGGAFGAGGGGGGGTAFASPANTGTWTFTNSNKTIQNTALATVGGQQCGQAFTTVAISGKQAFICHVDALPNVQYGCIGICDRANQGCPGFAGLGSVGYFTDSAGSWSQGSPFSGGTPVIANGTYVGVFVDSAAKLMWVTTDGSTYIGNGGATTNAAGVAAGTSGTSYSTEISAGTVYGVAGALVNTGVTWTIQSTLPGGWGSLPSGYSIL